MKGALVTGIFASESKIVFILLDFKRDVFIYFIPDINQCVNSYFETGKVELF